MRTEGVVMRSEAGVAHVKVQRSGGCGRCHEEGGCGGGAESRCDAFVVLSELDVKPGDRVQIDIPEGAALRAALLAYGLPLAGVLVGAAAAHLFVGSDAATLAGACAGFFASLLLMRRVRHRGTARPRIASILS